MPCFNTQPPEGGWCLYDGAFPVPLRFNTQPPEGGWRGWPFPLNQTPSFNTQPPEGGWNLIECLKDIGLCFNTQPPEGGWFRHETTLKLQIVSTHSRPKAAGPSLARHRHCQKEFQHTAARRRLAFHLHKYSLVF